MGTRKWRTRASADHEVLSINVAKGHCPVFLIKSGVIFENGIKRQVSERDALHPQKRGSRGMFKHWQKPLKGSSLRCLYGKAGSLSKSGMGFDRSRGRLPCTIRKNLKEPDINQFLKYN